MNLNKHLNKLKIQRLSIDANFHDQLSAYEKFRIMSIGAHIECLFFAEGFEDLYIPDCNFIYLPIYSTPKINEIDLPIIEQYEEKVSIYLYFNHLTFFNATDTCAPREQHASCARRFATRRDTRAIRR